MSISKKGPKKGNDAVASRLADFTGEKEVPIAGHNKMSGSQEQDDTYSGSEMDHGVDELANSLESTALGMESTKVRAEKIGVPCKTLVHMPKESRLENVLCGDAKAEINLKLGLYVRLSILFKKNLQILQFSLSRKNIQL